MLWLTYAWADNDEGDFDYLVQRLAEAGVETLYDKIGLVPGQRLWDQIAQRIRDPATTGWAVLVTPASMASEACREELSYALARALEERGFPVIGLLHQVEARDAPPALYVRLCVDTADADWPERVHAGLEGRAPMANVSRRAPIELTLHHPFAGDADLVCVEVRPRLEHLSHWRVAVPPSTPIEQFGEAPSGGLSHGLSSSMGSGTGSLRSTASA